MYPRDPIKRSYPTLAVERYSTHSTDYRTEDSPNRLKKISFTEKDAYVQGRDYQDIVANGKEMDLKESSKKDPDLERALSRNFHLEQPWQEQVGDWKMLCQKSDNKGRFQAGSSTQQVSSSLRANRRADWPCSSEYNSTNDQIYASNLRHKVNPKFSSPDRPDEIVTPPESRNLILRKPPILDGSESFAKELQDSMMSNVEIPEGKDEPKLTGHTVLCTFASVREKNSGKRARPGLKLVTTPKSEPRSNNFPFHCSLLTPKDSSLSHHLSQTHRPGHFKTKLSLRTQKNSLKIYHPQTPTPLCPRKNLLQSPNPQTQSHKIAPIDFSLAGHKRSQLPSPEKEWLSISPARLPITNPLKISSPICQVGTESLCMPKNTHSTKIIQESKVLTESIQIVDEPSQLQRMFNLAIDGLDYDISFTSPSFTQI